MMVRARHGVLVREQHRVYHCRDEVSPEPAEEGGRLEERVEPDVVPPVRRALEQRAYLREADLEELEVVHTEHMARGGDGSDDRCRDGRVGGEAELAKESPWGEHAHDVLWLVLGAMVELGVE